MPRTHTKTVGAKVTDGEYVVIRRAAGQGSVSTWAREVLLAAAAVGAPQRDEVLLAEMLALRTIVLNVQFAHVAGERQTPDSVQRLIERADREKLLKAQERFLSAASRRSR